VHLESDGADGNQTEVFCKTTLLLAEVRYTDNTVQFELSAGPTIPEPPEYYELMFPMAEMPITFHPGMKAEEAFAVSFSRHLHDAEVVLLIAEGTGITAITGLRISMGQTRLPTDWTFNGTSFEISVKFDPAISTNKDYSSMLIHGIGSSKAVPTSETIGDTQLLRSFYVKYQDRFLTLRGITLVRLTSLRQEDTETDILAVYLTDWDNAPAMERILNGTKWLGIPVYVIREQVIYLLSGEEFVEPVLVGARAGGGGMTAGVLLRDQQDDAVYMLQCRHGYQSVGELYPHHMFRPELIPVGQQCFYPPPSGIKAAVDQIEDSIVAHSHNEDQVTQLNERLCLLKRAEQVYQKSDGVAQYRNSQQLPFLSIGSVQHRSSPELDAAIIKLHLSKKNVIARYLLNPANTLKPSIKICASRHRTRNADLPQALTGLSLSTNEEMMRQFGQGSTQYLMKYGAATGLTKFQTLEKTLTLHDGRISVCIVPIHGGTTFPEESLVEPGDSSAPVFDKKGIVYGHVSARLVTSEVGFMLVWRETDKWAREKGYTFTLA
jgi:hypothetical protein